MDSDALLKSTVKAGQIAQVLERPVQAINNFIAQALELVRLGAALDELDASLLVGSCAAADRITDALEVHQDTVSMGFTLQKPALWGLLRGLIDQALAEEHTLKDLRGAAAEDENRIEEQMTQSLRVVPPDVQPPDEVGKIWLDWFHAKKDVQADHLRQLEQSVTNAKGVIQHHIQCEALQDFGAASSLVSRLARTNPFAAHSIYKELLNPIPMMRGESMCCNAMIHGLCVGAPCAVLCCHDRRTQVRRGCSSVQTVCVTRSLWRCSCVTRSGRSGAR
jgi:hypothetical protein